MDAQRTTDLLEETWRSTIDVGHQLGPDDWARPTDCPGWDVKDHVSHVIGTERLLEGLPGSDVDPGARDHVKNPLGEMNEREVELRRSRSGAEVLAELEELTEQRLATLRAGDDAYFAQERMTPTGPGTMLDFLNIRILDCWVHEQDIRRAVDRPGHMSGAPAEHTIDRLLRTIPIVVGKRAAAPEDSITRLEITGPVARSLTIRVDNGRAKVIDQAESAGPPLVTITMDTETFLVLAVGRRTAADVADRLTIEGDLALGQAIVDNLNMMI
jgi:uncharacterized protein (TIGR03083 family)